MAGNYSELVEDCIDFLTDAIAKVEDDMQGNFLQAIMYGLVANGIPCEIFDELVPTGGFSNVGVWGWDGQ